MGSILLLASLASYIRITINTKSDNIGLMTRLKKGHSNGILTKAVVQVVLTAIQVDLCAEFGKGGVCFAGDSERICREIFRPPIG